MSLIPKWQGSMVITSSVKSTNLKNCTEPLDPCRGNDRSEEWYQLPQCIIQESGTSCLSVSFKSAEEMIGQKGGTSCLGVSFRNHGDYK